MRDILTYRQIYVMSQLEASALGVRFVLSNNNRALSALSQFALQSFHHISVVANSISRKM
jgi:hypothetical protein